MRLLPTAMDEPSEKFDPVVNPETQMNDGSQREDEEDSPDDSEILQPETLVKHMKKLTLNPVPSRQNIIVVKGFVSGLRASLWRTEMKES